MAAPPTPAAVGAYGLRLTGLSADLLLPAAPSWPQLDLVRRVGRASYGVEALTDTTANLLFRNGGGVVLELEPPRATFTVPFELGDLELVHPYLAPAAAVFSRWLGREPFHGGGVVVADEAWAVLGGRQAGKSTLLAALALGGHDIVSDDVLVTEGARAYAGPRAIDLRAEAAEHLGAGTPLGVVGARERWRLALGPVAATTPLRGWVFLAWGDDVAISRLSAGDRLRRLVAEQAVLRPPDPRLLLNLAALPAVELRRPRDWRALPEAVDLMIETLSSRQPIVRSHD